MSKEPILQLKNLKVSFQSGKKFLPAVDGVSFELREGEILGIVGESGSGKSVTSLASMGLIPSPPGKIESGEILFEGKRFKKYFRKRVAKHSRKSNFNDFSGTNDFFEPFVYSW